MRKSLLRYLTGKYYDYIVITGDICHKGEYDSETVDFVKNLITLIGCGIENVIITPGNHDARRSKPRKALLDVIIKEYYENNSNLKIPDDFKTGLINEPFDVYYRLYKEIKGEAPPTKLHYYANEEIGVDSDYINFYVLNTSVFSGQTYPDQSDLTNKEKEKGDNNLFICDESLSKLSGVDNPGSLNITIAHHAVECFCDNEKGKFSNKLDSLYTDIYLCGHVHKTLLYTLEKTELEQKLVACGGLFLEERSKPSFITGEYDPDDCNVSLTSHAYLKGNNAWGVFTDAPKPYKNGYYQYQPKRLVMKSRQKDITLMFSQNDFQKLHSERSGEVTEPFIYDGASVTPIRSISRTSGMSIYWNGTITNVCVSDSSQPEILEITVCSAEELVSALGSNRRILLMEGNYNLTNISADYKSNPLVYFEDVYDGVELILDGVHNLTIQGTGDNKSEITVDPRYAYVVSFRNCSSISIDNIKVGHTENGTCAGGVFSFENSSCIKIDKSLMYGCGTIGLNLLHVTDMEITNSTIYECTYGIMNIIFGTRILYKNCIFKDNKEFTLVEISSSSEIIIDSCTFLNNISNYQYPMFSISQSENVFVEHSKFVNNKALMLIKQEDFVLDESNTFEDNTFDINQYP